MPYCKKSSGNIEDFMLKKELFENTTQHQPLTSWATLARSIDLISEKIHTINLVELIGRQGIEKTYEKTLRGVKGVRYLQRDKFNRVIGPYQKGELDTLPTKAQDLHLTIDIALQEYGQKLLQNKRGGIVAIEPETGEILVNVSTPTYAPDHYWLVEVDLRISTC